MSYIFRRLAESIAALFIVFCVIWTVCVTRPKQAVLTLSKHRIIYSGTVKNDRLNGKGKLTYSNKDSYVGYFRDGAFDGRGLFTSHDGWQYKGEFKKGQADGKGILTLKNGKTYKGEFKQGIYQK